MKIARHPFNRRPELHRIHESELFAGRSKRLRQLADIPRTLAQVHHSITTLLEHPIRALQGMLQQFADGFTPGNPVGNRLEAQYQTLNALQQGVMEVARDSLALGQAHFQAATHFGADLRYAEIIEPPQQDETHETTQDAKPGRLIEGWTDREVE